jgi:polyisoprenoid-binding protein YceI
MKIKAVALMVLFFASLSMPLAVSPQSIMVIYEIVEGESSLWVDVGKAGLFSAFGHEHRIGVKSFTGRVFLPKSGAAGAGGGELELEIDARSLVVLDKDVSDSDRIKIFNSMHNEVLESQKYQKVTFKSVSVSDLKQAGGNDYNLKLNGDLTLHGVTKRIAVPLKATVTPQQLRVTGKYTLKQSDYGIKQISAGGGTVKVKDEVVVNFNIIAKA